MNALLTLEDLGTNTATAVKAARRHGETATTSLDHGAAIWLAQGRDGGRLTPERTTDRCQWKLADGKTMTAYAGTVSANDAKTGAALALALSTLDEVPTTATEVHKSLTTMGVTTTDTRPMGKGLTWVTFNKKRDTAKHVRAYVDAYVATRNAATEDGQSPSKARTVAVETADKAAGKPATEASDPTEPAPDAVTVNPANVWKVVDEVMPDDNDGIIHALTTAVDIGAISRDRLAHLAAAVYAIDDETRAAIATRRAEQNTND